VVSSPLLPGQPRERKGEIGPVGLRLGIDVGGTKVALAVGTADGALRARRRIPAPATGDPRRDVDAILEAARGLLAETGAGPGDLEAVGASCPGPLEARTGRILAPPNLPGWVDVPLADWLAEALGAPARVENDADAAALAEWRTGAARGARDAVYLTMSTGVGGGLVLDGRIHRGAIFGAGEVGHAPVAWEGEPCACGLRGCLEAYVGGGALARRLRRIAPDGSAVVAQAGRRNAITAEHLVAAARAGDAFARAEMERFNDYLARGITWLVMVLAPDVVVLGTIAAAAGEALCLDPVRRRVAAHVWPVAARSLRILPSALGTDLPYHAALAAASADN